MNLDLVRVIFISCLPTSSLIGLGFRISFEHHEKLRCEAKQDSDSSQNSSDQIFIKNNLNCLKFNIPSVSYFPSICLNMKFLWVELFTACTELSDLRDSSQNSWIFDMLSSIVWLMGKSDKCVTSKFFNFDTKVLSLQPRIWNSLCFAT